MENIRADVRRKRMIWQTTRSDNDRLEYTEQNVYKKAVRRSGESCGESGTGENGLWRRAWKMLAKRQTLRPASNLNKDGKRGK